MAVKINKDIYVGDTGLTLNQINTNKTNIATNTSNISTNTTNISTNKTNISNLTPVVLYNNTTGTTGTVTLSSSSANYTYIEIFYRDNDSRYGSQKVYSPNGKKVVLTGCFIGTTSLYLRSNLVTISGTSITKNFYAQFTDGTVSPQNSNANFYIVRVIGYK